MSYPTLEALFNEYASNVKINNDLHKRLIEYNQLLLTKSPEHIEFFGGMLVGVNRLNIGKSEFNYFFDEVLDIDQLGLRHGILNVNGVDKRLVISTEPYNNTCVWLVFKALTDKTINGKLAHEIAFQALVAMHLRFMSQLQWKYFPHPADRQVAQSALNSLDNRYDLKIYGSWYETIKARCRGFLDPKWKHYDAFKDFKNPVSVKDMINRLKGGIEQIFQKQSNIFYAHHKEDMRVASVGGMFDGEEGKELKTLFDELNDNKRYLVSTMVDVNTFVKPKLVELIESIIAVHRDTFLEGLKWISDNINHDDKLERWVENVLVHANEHLKKNKVDSKNLIAVMRSLKDVYTSSMASNALLSDNKQQMDKWLKKITHKRLAKYIPNARTSIMLYLILRIMSRNYYQ